MSGRIAVVHNGIIENHAALRQFLEGTGVTFVSQTDTDVLGHLIAYHLYGDKSGTKNGKNGHGRNGNGHGAEKDAGGGLSLLDAVLAALAEVVGTFGIAVVAAARPDCIVAARRGSPLLVGIGDSEYIVASDAAAIVAHTSNVIYLEDNEAVEITRSSLRTVTLDAAPVTKTVEQIAVSRAFTRRSRLRASCAIETRLRFFNVYGPRQDPRSPYSGVISIFCDRLGRGQPISIFGDGEQVRDFVYVGDVTWAAMAARPAEPCVFNVCIGRPTSILTLENTIARLCGTTPSIGWAPQRDGDIRVSIGNPQLAREQLGFTAQTELDRGLATIL